MDPLTDFPEGNLLTARLRLRSWRDEDAAPMLAMSTDPEGMSHFPRVVTAVGNQRSIGVMRRPGMHTDPSDDFDSARVPPGHELRRHVLYRLRADEWRTGRGRPRARLEG